MGVWWGWHAGPGASGLPPRTTLAVVVARLVVVPMLGVVVVLSADRLGFLPPDDKMFRFVLLMQHAMPSSIQIGAHLFPSKLSLAILTKGRLLLLLLGVHGPGGGLDPTLWSQECASWRCLQQAPACCTEDGHQAGVPGCCTSPGTCTSPSTCSSLAICSFAGTACSLRGFGEKEVAAILFFQHISAVLSMGCCLFSFFYILYG